MAESETLFTFSLTDHVSSVKVSEFPTWDPKASANRSRRRRRLGEVAGESPYSLLLGNSNLFRAHAILLDVVRAIWLPALLGLLFNGALYVVVHVYPADADFNAFLRDDIISDGRLSVVGTVVAFLVVFSQNQYVSSNRELAIFYAEVCANCKAIALLLATMRKRAAFEKHGFVLPATRDGLEAAPPDDLVRDCVVELLVTKEDLKELQREEYNNMLPPWIELADAQPEIRGEKRLVRVRVAQAALFLVSIPYLVKWKNRTKTAALDLNRLPFAHSAETKRRFNMQFAHSRPACTATEALLVLVGEDLLGVQGMSSDLELYFQRIIQRIVHLDVQVHALSLYRPPGAITFLFWVLFWLFFVLSSIRDLMATSWPSVPLSLLYIVGLVGAMRVSQSYVSPFDVSESRTGQLSYVSLEASLTETAVFALFNRTMRPSQREKARYAPDDPLEKAYEERRLSTMIAREQRYAGGAEKVQ